MLRIIESLRLREPGIPRGIHPGDNVSKTEVTLKPSPGKLYAGVELVIGSLSVRSPSRRQQRTERAGLRCPSVA